MPTPIPVESYPLLMDLINQTYLDRVEQITAAQVNDDDSIVFVGLDNPKKIAGKITDGDISMKLMGTGEKPQFAAPKTKKKPKNCSSPTSISCGLTCLPAKTKAGKDTVCKKPISLNQKAQKKSIVDSAKKSRQPKKESIADSVKKGKQPETAKKSVDLGVDPDKLLTDAIGRSTERSGISGLEAGIDRLKELKNLSEQKTPLSASSLYASLDSTFRNGGLASGEASGHYMQRIYNKLSDAQKDKLAEDWHEDKYDYAKPGFAADSIIGQAVKEGHAKFLDDLDLRIKKIRVRDEWE